MLRDFDSTAAFYERLGFGIVFRDAGWMILQRGDLMLEFFAHGISAEQAVEGADIITTATADKHNATILSDNMIGPGVHINGVGGDCPGKTEMHRDILLRSDIFVEFPPQTRMIPDRSNIWQ